MTVRVAFIVIVHGPEPGRLKLITLESGLWFATVIALNNEPGPWLAVLVTTTSARAICADRKNAVASRGKERCEIFILILVIFGSERGFSVPNAVYMRLPILS